MVLSHRETNIVFFHYLLDVFNEHAALDGCLINNEYAHKYKIKSGRDYTDDLLQLLCSLQVKKGGLPVLASKRSTSLCVSISRFQQLCVKSTS